MLGTKEEIEDKILSFVKSYVAERHMTPRYKEIAKAVGFKSVGSVFRYVKDLEDKGLLESNGMRGTNVPAGSMESGYGGMLEHEPEEDFSSRIPLVGTIACGGPIYAEENIEDYLKIDPAMFGHGEYFALRAKGDSMINAGIDSGDIVICRKQQTAEVGQIVVALIDDEATLKRYYRDDKKRKIVLKPENDYYEPMEFDDIRIQGRAIKVIKDLS